MKIKEVIKHKILSLYTNVLYDYETKIVNTVLQDEDFQPIDNIVPNKREKIAIVVGNIVRFSGGHTSLLRLGTGLAANGKDVTYISFNNQSALQMEQNAKSNLPNVKGTFLPLNNANFSVYDIVVATSWQSVYYAKKFKGYKMYFVQDFEPYFFKLNERYLLAKKTYELGFHIVSLGKWNLEQIKKNCSPCSTGKYDYISFPYEPSEYMFSKRAYYDYKKKRKLRIAVYSKEDGKRIPNLLQIILKKAAEDLKSKGIELDVIFFGFEKNIKLQVGQNYGKLNRLEMLDLYEKCDFGMVASMTNISLVPYEMLATGLPLIEFSEGSFSYFFPENSAIIVDFNYRSLVNGLLTSIESPDIIEERMLHAKTYLNTLSWNNSCTQFIDIINKI